MYIYLDWNMAHTNSVNIESTTFLKQPNTLLKARPNQGSLENANHIIP